MALISIADKDLNKLGSSGISYSNAGSSSRGQSSQSDFKKKKGDKITIEPADYNFVDPQSYASKFGDFNRSEFFKNFGTAKDFSLQTLETELQGLKGFVPAAAALKRNTISADNLFNQEERARQLKEVLPYADEEFASQREDLKGQRSRANAYAEGRLPDKLQDRAFELGVRSRSADLAGFSGIGPRSMEASKTSDLMSAEQRLELSKYGDNLLTQNINARTATLQNEGNVKLAPTEYSSAGTDVRVTPEVGAGQLRTNYSGNLNASTMLTPSDALATTVNEEQFKTNLNQRTREFNASNQLQLKMAKMAGGGGGGGGGGGAAQQAFDRDFQVLAQGYAAGLSQQNVNDAAGSREWGSIASAIPVFAPVIEGIYNSIADGWSEGA